MREVNGKHLLQMLERPEGPSRAVVQAVGDVIGETFLTVGQADRLRQLYGSPLYVYSEERLLQQAERALTMPSAFGHTVRYAMKASSNSAILRILTGAGLHIDASSGFEAKRCLALGIPGPRIKLTSQQLPSDLHALVSAGILFNACSLTQLSVYGQLFPGTSVSVRINPGLGAGHNNRTNVGGPASSFGICHASVSDIQEIARQHNLTIHAIHSHVGSGTDSAVWEKCADLTLAIVREFPDVQTVNLGGGFKVGRMPDEKSTDLHQVGLAIAERFRSFQASDSAGRALHLEIEPGSFFAVKSGVVLATVVDSKDTGPDGYSFLIVDTGMTEVLRPSIYGAQHPLHVVPSKAGVTAEEDVLVAGHCCESGDILTPAPGDPEGLLTRKLAKATIGDLLVIADTGAYCASMATPNYNAFPKAPEVLLSADGTARLVRRAEPPEEVFRLEIE
jgi:diaminopimelate decarboxylase